MNLRTIDDRMLDAWGRSAVDLGQAGHVASYIPALAGVDPSLFAAVLVGENGVAARTGAVDTVVPFLSVAKVFLLLYLLRTVGPEEVFARVGREPSDLAFNALEQLERDHGWPRNPMINSGAIALCSLLPGDTADERCQALRSSLCAWGGVEVLLDRAVLASAQSQPNPRNQALVERLARAGVLREPAMAYATYQRVCCLATSVTDLGLLGARIACPADPSWDSAGQTTLDLVATCGLYEASARHFARIGLPMKSGVSGLVLAIARGHGALAVLSPPLDHEGNSLGGLWFVEQVATAMRKQ